MAFQSIPQSTFASGFGQGVGQGLSEQLPKEIERTRLSHGLKNLGEDFSNLTPMEQIAKLVSVPGMNAQTAMAFIPYLKEQQSRQALKKRAGEDEGGVLPSIKEQDPGQGEFRQRLEAKDFGIAKDNQQLLADAKKLLALYPAANEKELITIAKEADNERLSKDAAISKRSSDAEDEFNKWTSGFLQKSGNDIYKDIIGEMKGDYLDEARNRALDEGISPITAGKKAAEDLLDFAKTRQQLKTNKAAFLSPLFGKSGKQVLKDIENFREAYQKRDQLEFFRNDLIDSHKLTPEEADRLAFPVSAGEKEYISSLPKPLKRHLGKLGIPSTKKLSEDQVRQIIGKITANDSPRSIAMDLISQGYDGQDFIQQAKRFKGKKMMNERQERDLTTFSQRPSLGDIALFGAGKLADTWRTQ